VHGSGALIRWLLDNDLADEIALLIVPVILGPGTWLFAAAGPDIALDLVDSRADSKGVTIQVYHPPDARSIDPPPSTEARCWVDDQPQERDRAAVRARDAHGP
jgi:RibD C-terminal domain